MERGCGLHTNFTKMRESLAETERSFFGKVEKMPSGHQSQPTRKHGSMSQNPTRVLVNPTRVLINEILFIAKL